MHILVTNDDGPPSSDSSPYVLPLVRYLQKAGHDVSVCLPSKQQSWIGKAYLAGQTLQPLWYYPEDSLGSEEMKSSLLTGQCEKWLLVDGSPAACVQMALHHYFQDRRPFDLVVSGPNFGRNTTAVYALSSGTIGGAMEAAVCGKRSIAASFALSGQCYDPAAIQAACRHTVRIIETLLNQWPGDGTVDLYSINVPLLPDVEKRDTLWTNLLRNQWGDGSCFQEIPAACQRVLADEAHFDKHRNIAQTHVQLQDENNGSNIRRFRWAPNLSGLHTSVEISEPGNDGKAIRDGKTR